MFSKKYDVTEEHTDIINKYLPKQIWKPVYQNDDLNLLKQYTDEFIEKLVKDKEVVKGKYAEAKRYNQPTIIKIINTQVKCEKTFGMVDLGLVERFNSKTTGNSYENGWIQATIENSFEEVWAKNNSQYEAVEKAKKLLIGKTLSLYPATTVIQNFKINFREMGNSGNVFIYLCGTATFSKEFSPINYADILLSIKEKFDEIAETIKLAKTMSSNMPSKKKIMKEITEYEKTK